MFKPAVDLNVTAPLIRRTGANLPHWRLEGATYAVTFHLADSIPAAQLKAWRIEREHIVARAEQLNRPLSVIELQRLDVLHGEKIQNWLDRGQGSCVLKVPSIASLVQGALQHFDGQRYTLLAWCVMPNHVHAIVQPALGHDLSRILMSWKGFTGKKARELLGTQGGGEFWQQESYDRIIRDHAELHRQIRYVVDNPVKAHLPNWPWVGRAIALPGDASPPRAIALLGEVSPATALPQPSPGIRIGRKPDGTVEPA